jgi:predicted nuclease with TOPRIM domain
MREQLQSRLEELKREFEVGERRLRDLERQQIQLRETMLRIDGAIQVLSELLSEDVPASPPASPSGGADGNLASPVPAPHLPTAT